MTETWKVSTGLLSRAAAEGLAARIDEAASESGIVVAAFAVEPDSADWRVEAYVGERPPARELIAELFGDLPVVTEKLPPADWVARSQSLLKPIRAGRFFIHGEHDRDKRISGAVCVEIQAGQAFGTGHHGTTRGCLLAIDHVLRHQRPKRMLDLGCGSAILAIAAARAVRQPVLAGDVDPVAVSTAKQNARLNQAAGLVDTVVAAGMRGPKLCPPNRFDLIVANILAGPLQSMKRDIAHALSPGGQLILSGITVDQECRLLGAYRPFGLFLHRRWRPDGWSTLLLRK
ncbi:MAG: 50S ribosomal protein L11 methyltransferase [Pseudomonadota bacterium]